jgi:hypothetical protein
VVQETRHSLEGIRDLQWQLLFSQIEMLLGMHFR